MFKKISIALTLAMLLALGANFAQAQMPNVGQIPPEAIAELAKESPMTQADVDVYIKILPQLAKAATDPSAAANIQKASGLSDIRLGMIMTKISLAQAVNMGMTLDQLNVDQLPEAMRPTEDDIALVKTNMDKINAAMMQMHQGQQ